jgi:anti-anti-sigma factor
MLKVYARKLGNITVLCLQGRIVNGEAESLREVVDSQSRVSSQVNSDVRAVVLDLARVSTIDAGGLGLLLELRKQTASRGIGFKLMNATRFVRRVLEITRLDSVFEIIPGVELSQVTSRPRQRSVMKLAPCA